MAETKFRSAENAIFDGQIKQATDSINTRFGDVTHLIDGQIKHVTDLINEKFGWLDKWLRWAIVAGIAAIVSLWGGFGLLYKEISGLDKRLVTIEKTIESVPGKVAEFKTIADAIRSTSDAMRSSSDSMRSTVTTLGDEILTRVMHFRVTHFTDYGQLPAPPYARLLRTRLPSAQSIAIGG